MNIVSIELKPTLSFSTIVVGDYSDFKKTWLVRNNDITLEERQRRMRGSDVTSDGYTKVDFQHLAICLLSNTDKGVNIEIDGVIFPVFHTISELRSFLDNVYFPKIFGWKTRNLQIAA